MNRNLKIFLIVIVGLSFVIASWYLIKGDILFHVDIARDFLAMEKIINLKKPTLIGARSGGIPGLFHGPLWFYLNLPAFILGHGNPLVVGAFWIFLFTVSLIVVFKCAKTIFDAKTSYLATALFASVTAKSIYGVFNPYGAVIASPIFFCFLYLYFKKKKLSYAVYTALALGAAIHFQMAWALPIASFTFFLIIYDSIKRKILLPFIAFSSSLTLSLITFILFDLRHDFLQVRSLFQYLSGKTEMGNLPVLTIIKSRIRGFGIEGLQLTSSEFLPISLALSAVIIWLVYTLFNNRKIKNPSIKETLPYRLFFYLYSAYWLSVLLFKGPVWNYYLVPFLPLVAILFSSLSKYFNRTLFYSLYSAIIIFNFYQGGIHLSKAGQFIGQDGSSWQFNFALAKKVYADSKGEFGYYILTPELFGYSPRYAMNHTQKKYPQFKSFPFEKKETTYLIFAPKPQDRPEYNPLWWRQNQVKILKNPVAVFNFNNGFTVEKFRLNEKEIAISSESTLIKDLHFR